jgi:hypothetical protein
VKTSTCKVPVILVGFSGNLNFLDRVSQKAFTSNFGGMMIIKIKNEILIRIEIEFQPPENMLYVMLCYVQLVIQEHSIEDQIVILIRA